MPLTIAFVSHIGNVMKSTLAAAMGLALVDAGLNALAIDLDPEHRQRGASLSTWLQERAERHPLRSQLPAIAPETAADALNEITNADADIVLIDCPSRATQASYLIASEADFTVLPMAPGDKDATLAANVLAELVAAGVRPERIAVILTRTGSPAEAAEYRSWIRAAIAEHDLGPITVIADDIPERITIRNALTRRLAITEAQPVSVGRAARRAVNALIDALDVATVTPASHPALEGAA